jgi:hypothetical protein
MCGAVAPIQDNLLDVAYRAQYVLTIMPALSEALAFNPKLA